VIVLPPRGVPPRRQLYGGLLVLVGLPLLTAVLVAARDRLSYATPVLLVLSVVVATALLGGLRPAVPAALAGALSLNYFFTPPLHELRVERPQDLLVLGVYLAVAVSVSLVVDLAARRTAEAARAKAEAEALSSVAGASLAEQETLPAVLERVRTVFGASQVTLEDELGVVLAAVGEPGPDESEQRLPAGRAQLVVRGPALFAEDRRVLAAFAEAAATALAGRRLAEQAATAEAVDRLRTALLAAVGHDLRTPLAGVKAAVSSLRAQDVTWTEEERAELLATIDESADRLGSLVANLLDASRLRAGSLSVSLAPVGLDEVVAAALVSLPGRERVRVEVPESLPPVLADAGLLERVVANLVENSLRHDPGQVLVSGAPGCVRVIDHGPGIVDTAGAFAPFQRLGDRSPGGVGLGLAVAKGFVEAMGGTLEPSETEGGGLTMTVELAS
jgi:two-component system sensor histidine kinase KdpD